MRSRPALLVVVTFLVLIALGFGALLAFAPGMTMPDRRGLAALFTSVSAVCVTGLTVVDLSHDMSFAGQLVVLLLIQIGGLGVLTVSNWILLALRGRLGHYSAIQTHQVFGELPLLSPAKVLKRVIVFTFGFELAGCVLLFPAFARDYPPGEALWLALFHAVSAFCNAGFSLFSDSLVGYQHHWLVNLTIAALIFAGGIGFLAAADVVEKLRALLRGRRRRLAFHTRVVLSVSFALIVAGAGVFLVLEWRNTFVSDALGGRVLEALFLSVTARTAGFNSVNTAHVTNMTLVILIVLMVVGASPGSAGGGVKTTAAAVLWALVRGRVLNRDRVELMGRSIPRDLVAKSLALIVLYGVVVLLALVALQATEFGELPHDQTRGLFLEHLFEVVSALSTVGLSTGVTSSISDGGLVVLMLCMFIGRVGPLVLAASIIGERRRLAYAYAEADIMVG